jgi:hypothetical protein
MPNNGLFVQAGHRRVWEFGFGYGASWSCVILVRLFFAFKKLPQVTLAGFGLTIQGLPSGDSEAVVLLLAFCDDSRTGSATRPRPQGFITFF